MRIPFGRQAKYWMWSTTSRVGLANRSAELPGRATVLITYYDPVRLQHLDSQIRQVLRCGFVERLVVSNHNPAFRVEEATTIRDSRLEFRNEPVRRGCGYRWQVARDLPGEYLIVLDDDLLLFPGQIATLFSELLREPSVPHGLAGFRTSDDAAFTYLQASDCDVDFLCEAYAVSKAHLQRYHAICHRLTRDPEVLRIVDRAADFVVISASGRGRPKVHDVGPLFRCLSFRENGHAVHKQTTFEEDVRSVAAAIQNVHVDDEATASAPTGRPRAVTNGVAARSGVA